jgi:PilZ domain
MSSSLERRRFSRFIVPLLVDYQTQCPESGDLLQGQGVMRDLSLTGAFFHLEHPPNFQAGQILSLTITAPLPFLDNPHISHLQAEGEVVRLEPPRSANPCHGVAVSFLQNLSFASL